MKGQPKPSVYFFLRSIVLIGNWLVVNEQSTFDKIASLCDHMIIRIDTCGASLFPVRATKHGRCGYINCAGSSLRSSAEHLCFDKRLCRILGFKNILFSTFNLALDALNGLALLMLLYGLYLYL